MTKLIAGNWKMFKGPIDTLAFFDTFEAPDGVDVVLCPPFVSLEAAVGEEWPIYAQNVHWADEGAFTGEISARMLLELGVQGRSSGIPSGASTSARPTTRCGSRAEAALAAGLQVIACVGETEAERETGETEAVLRRQVEVLPQHDGARDRLRAGLGDRHREDRDARDGRGRSRVHQVASRDARSLRRLGEAGKRRRASLPAVDRRRVGRRSLPRRRVVLEPVSDRSFPLVTLVVLDGWGLAPAGPGNAVELAETPVFDRLWATFPHTTLAASGPGRRAAGRPDGELGGRPPHDRLGPGALPGSDARERRGRGRHDLRERCTSRRLRPGAGARGRRPPARARLPRRRPLAHRSSASPSSSWRVARAWTTASGFTLSPTVGTCLRTLRRPISRRSRRNGSQPSSVATTRWIATTGPSEPSGPSARFSTAWARRRPIRSPP